MGWTLCEGCEKTRKASSQAFPPSAYRVKAVPSHSKSFKALTSYKMSTPTAPRRSARLAAKAPLKYYSDEDLISDIMIKYCRKYKLIYSDDLIPQYLDWYNTTNRQRRDKDYYVTDWLHYESEYIQLQFDAIKAEKAIINYCTKKRITYEPIMLIKFMTWKTDPANYLIVTEQPCVWLPDRYLRGIRPCVRLWFDTLTFSVNW
jgi:hypothetical protein